MCGARAGLSICVQANPRTVWGTGRCVGHPRTHSEGIVPPVKKYLDIQSDSSLICGTANAEQQVHPFGLCIHLGTASTCPSFQRACA